MTKKNSKKSKKSSFNYKKNNKNITTEEEYSVEEQVKIVIPEKLYYELVAAVKELAKNSLEIGGQLKIQKIDDKIVIKDYNLLKQTVSGGDFEIDEEEIAKWMMKHMDEPDFKDWTGWWHSHHNMELFWSTTDDEQFKKMLEGNNEAFGIVFDSTGNFLARHDIKTQYGTITRNKLEVEIERPGNNKFKEIAKKIKPIVQENCKEKEITKFEYYKYPATNSYYNYEKTSNADYWGLEEYSLEGNVYEELSKPWGLKQLMNNVYIHKLVNPKWTVKDECDYWQLDINKIQKLIDEKEITKQPTCLFCSCKLKRYEQQNDVCDYCLSIQDYNKKSSFY